MQTGTPRGDGGTRRVLNQLVRDTIRHTPGAIPGPAPRPRAGQRPPAGPVTARVYGPSDVPRLRDRILETVRSGFLHQVLGQHPGKLHFPYHRNGRMWSVTDWMEHLERWLVDAELFYVTADMTEVVRQAAAAKPTYEVHEDAMPARVGFVVYGGVMCTVDDTCPDMAPGERCDLTAALWAPVADTSDGPGVMLVTFQDTDVLVETRPEMTESTAGGVTIGDIMYQQSGPLAYHEEYALPYGNQPWGEEHRAVNNAAVGAAMATWIMMGQRITQESTERAPRGLRRQYERDGRPEPVVRTVTLRQAASPKQEREPGQESSRVYQHRWVVQGYGYWRNTWYPSKQEHRQQYVHVPAYIKGPEGAPLIGGERVNVLRR